MVFWIGFLNGKSVPLFVVVMGYLMKFDELFRNAMASLEDTFGESVTFIPSDGVERQVKAMIDRSQLAEDSSGIPVRVMTITISGDPERGVPANTVDTYGDVILVEKIRGEDPQPVTILEVITGAGNVTKLICR